MDHMRLNSVLLLTSLHSRLDYSDIKISGLPDNIVDATPVRFVLEETNSPDLGLKTPTSAINPPSVTCAGKHGHSWSLSWNNCHAPPLDPAPPSFWRFTTSPLHPSRNIREVLALICHQLQRNAARYSDCMDTPSLCWIPLEVS